jgi:predicted DNA-binding transcriptional regulator YafY
MKEALRRSQLYLMLSTVERVTAAMLAQAAGVSLRTIYRDMAGLADAGLCVTGSPRVGYRLPEAPELAPLFLTRDERRALVAGATAVRSSDEAVIARAAASLLKKAQAL